MQIAIGAALALLLALIGLVIWLSKSRSDEVRAEAAVDALKKANDIEDKADEIMAEPVADESEWLKSARKRLSDGSRKS